MKPLKLNWLVGKSSETKGKVKEVQSKDNNFPLGKYSMMMTLKNETGIAD